MLKIRKLMAVMAPLLCTAALVACEMPHFAALDPKPQVEVSKIMTLDNKPQAPALYCKVGRGSALFGRNWYDFSDASFSLHKGDHADIHLSRQRGAEQMSIQAFFDVGGQKLIFCPVMKGNPSQRVSCGSLYALEDDLKDGIKRTFDIPSAVRGGMITCSYDASRLRQLAEPGD
jgi:hypothetical protein